MDSDSDTVLARVRVSFVAKAAPRAATIRSAIVADDRQSALFLAHQLNGMAGTFGFDSIGDEAACLEAAITSGRSWHETAAKLATSLEQMAERKSC
ncbi:MAG: Hpt domain-containing protein [Erythrobacter sp.]|nr:Hpt domain-containing protein [Erythrobacter sp.]MDZ4272644.1 Hpt domain-containing protein [Erythrobacter sp.]